MKNFPEMNYALLDGMPVSVSEIAKHPDSRFTCPACGEAVDVRRGENASLCFTHSAGVSCGHERDLSLRFTLKELIVRLGRISIPPVYIEFSTHKAPIRLSGAKTISVEKAELVRTEEKMIPEILLYSGSKRLWVILRTDQSISGERLEKLAQKGISAIEINLSQPDFSPSQHADDVLTPLVLGEGTEKKWLFNAAANEYLHRFIDASDRRPVIIRGTDPIVERCPLAAHPGSGKRFAEYINDCFGCQYFIDREIVYKVPPNDPRSYTSKIYIFCSGRNKVATLKDLHDYMNRH